MTVIICCGGPIPPCDHDKREIENLILFKKRLKKHLTEVQNGATMNIDKEKRGNEK